MLHNQLAQIGRKRIPCATIFLSSVMSMMLLSHQAEAVQVFIIAGQSNATGQGNRGGLDRDIQLQPDVRYWYDTDRGISRKPGSRDRGFSTLRPLGGTIGPELGAGHILADSIEEEIVIVKVAQGGTTLTQLDRATDWSIDSTDELYDKLISNVQQATEALVAEGKQVDLAGFFWMQGESDAISSSPLPDGAVESYQTNLERFIQKTRDDLATPQLPFFIGKLRIGDGTDFRTSVFGTYDFTPDIWAAQAGAAASDPDTYLIDTSDFSLKDDHLHFNQAGQLDLGMAFANAYLQTLPEPSTVLLCCFAFGTLLNVRRRCSQ